MTKEVFKLKLYAIKAALEESSNINEYKKVIRSIVKVALQNIKDQVKDLDDLVLKSEKMAMDNYSTPITKCVRKEKSDKSKKIKTKKLLQCKKTFSFDVLKVKLTKLAYVKVKALSIIPKCTTLHPLSNKKLKNCIQNNLDDTYSEVSQIKYDIEDQAASIYDEANNCIEDNLGGLDLDIEDIQSDFSKCVDDTIYS